MKMPKKSLLFWGGIALFWSVVILLLMVEEIRTFVIAVGMRAVLFAKKHMVVLITGFFLVKGKFVLALFMKKLALLSATGLGKRYLIEKVLTQQFKIHFLDHITGDVKRLLTYIKRNFKSFPLVKQIIAGFVFIGSLGFVGKFLGGVLAMKVFIAKIWSFLLALSLKVGTSILYFFTDYLWGSWFAPIVEIVIFNWLLEFMEKIPFLKPFMLKLYALFTRLFGWMERYLEIVLHLPVKRLAKYLRGKVKQHIHAFIGSKRLSMQRVLVEKRVKHPSPYQRLAQRAKTKRTRRRGYQSAHKKLQEKRKRRR